VTGNSEEPLAIVNGAEDPARVFLPVAAGFRAPHSAASGVK